MKRVYLICPVSKCDTETSLKLDAYVLDLELRGYKAHYPPRDVNQHPSRTAEDICEAYLLAMTEADEVHVWWDPNSKGSHFDFGMACMLCQMKDIKFVMVNEWTMTEQRSYGNLLKNLSNYDNKIADVARVPDEFGLD